MIRQLLVILVLLLGFIACDKNTEPDPMIKEKELQICGADASFLPELRKTTVRLHAKDGTSKDPLLILKEEGVNVIRLRLWTNDNDPNSSLTEVKKLSEEIKSLGLKTMITVHYSDSWADPGKQTKPARWASLPYEILKDSFASYTAKIAKELQPDYIQIGNEINAGLLWPDGNINRENQLLELLTIGVQEVRAHSKNSKIIIHYAGLNGSDFFFDKVKSLDYDMIGISYYTMWHGKDLQALSSTLSLLRSKYNKEIVIAETSYPFTLGWNDWTNNVVGLESQLHPDFPATPEGQKNFIQTIKDIIINTAGGAGFCYWGGEWVSFRGPQATNGSTWENQALWDFQFKRLPVMDVFHD